MIKLVITGAAGRMGSRIVELAKMSKNPKFNVVYQLESDQSSLLHSPTILTVPYGTDLNQISLADVVIDFTVPEATLSIAAKAAQYGKPIVIGTTGFSPLQERNLRKILKSVPVLKSANMSLGVNVFFKIARDAARVLSKFKVKIQETHHIHKKDSPSGTALQAGQLMEEFLQGKIIYESKREGEVVGDHRAVFMGELEDLEIFHHAKSRDIFATGALFAATWLRSQRPGFYTMQDALSLK